MVLNISAIVFMVPMGLSSATAVLVGRAYGAKDRTGVIRAGACGLFAVAGIATLIGLVVWPTAPLLVGAYTREAALLAVAVPALILATLFFVADGVQVVAALAVRAAGDVWWPTIMHIFSYGAVMFPLGYLLSHQGGLAVDGMVWAVIVASLISATLLTGRFIRVARRLPA